MKNVNSKFLGNLLLGMVLVTVVVAPTAMVFQWTASSGYAPWRNYVSDLSVGSAGSSIAYIVMILSFALLAGTFFSLSPNLLKTNYGVSAIANVGSFFGIAFAIDGVIMVFFPLDPSRPEIYQSHIICGIVIFLCMTFFLGTFGFALKDKAGLFRLGSYFALAAALLCITFAVLLFLVEITETINQSTIVYLIQWSAFLMFNLWAFFTGLQLRRDNAQTPTEV